MPHQNLGEERSVCEASCPHLHWRALSSVETEPLRRPVTEPLQHQRIETKAASPSSAASLCAARSHAHTVSTTTAAFERFKGNKRVHCSSWGLHVPCFFLAHSKGFNWCKKMVLIGAKEKSGDLN